ncbi:MAG TPA: methyltransferase type 11 [Chloroflexi bacterium]|nr:methyltransferase type 11 [Chloroflexota bacterium]
MAFKRIADNTQDTSVATRLRRQRFQIFWDLLHSIPGTVKILDIGGTYQFWEMMTADFALEQPFHVTLLNPEPETIHHPNFSSLAGDGRAMPNFRNGQFEVVFSNSTIEHVGSFADQMRMANEIRRVGQRFFVQTPNRYFPIEPHFVFPFFQFLPIVVRVWLVQHFDLGWFSRIPDQSTARREVTSIRLLNRSDFVQLFPQAQIFEERFYGLVKSFIAYTPVNR